MLKKMSVLKKCLCFSAACAISCGAFVAESSEKEKTGILLVAFGTSQPGAKKAYTNIEKNITKKFSKTPVRWAYTSKFIRKKLAKQGIKTLSVLEALEEMKKDNFTQVAVQSLHVVNGGEYEEVLNAVKQFTLSNNEIKIAVGLPLLISSKDLNAFAKAIKTIIPKDRKSTDGIVLMGHGNHNGMGDTTYLAAQAVLTKYDKNIFLGTVEGHPSFDEMEKEMKSADIKKAFLIPMMIVAGDHAVNDLAGDEDDSWKKMLTKKGVKSIPLLKGLGENDAIVAIFAKHLQTALDKLSTKK